MADTDIAQRIRKRTIKATELEPDIALLASMFRRTTHTIVPKPEQISLAGIEDVPSIALISRDIRLEREGADPANAELFVRNSVLQGIRIKPPSISEYRESYLDDLHDAAAAGARVVCFGEGALPWGHESDDVAERIRRVRHNGKLSPGDKNIIKDVDRKNSEFLAEVQKIAQQRNLLIIGGSAHDRNCNNIGRVFWPNGSKGSVYRKIQGALKLKEKLLPRSSPEFEIFETPDFYIVVLICVDAYAPETVLRCGLLAVQQAALDRHNKGSFWPRKPVRYIFVPSFNDRGSKLIWDACKELSQLCDTVVAYVNCQMQYPRSGLFASGYCVDDHDVEDVQSIVGKSIRLRSIRSTGVLYTIPDILRDELQKRNRLKEDGVLRTALAYAAADMVKRTEL